MVANLILIATSFCFALIAAIRTVPFSCEVGSNNINTFELNLHGNGVREVYIGRKQRFHASIVNTTGSSHEPVKEAVLSARLMSREYIISVDRTGTDDTGRFEFSYMVRDHVSAPLYLQIRLTWLRGGLLDPILPIKKKAASVFLNYSVYLGKVIYNSSVTILEAAEESAPTESINMGLCRGGAEEGRWVNLLPGQDCPARICLGSSREVDLFRDRFNFNGNYSNDRWVWAPYNCVLRLYSRDEVRRCFRERNYRNIGFSGDSLLREHLQNLYSLLSDTASLPKLHEHATITIDLGDGFDVTVYFQQTVRKLPERLDVHLWNIPLHRFQVMNIAEERMPLVIGKQLLNSYNIWKETGGNESMSAYYIHPRIQSEDIRINRPKAWTRLNHTIESFACMTTPRQEIQLATIRGELSKWGDLKAVDGFGPTLSRWESSWDGIHYSLMLQGGLINISSGETFAPDCPEEKLLPGAAHRPCEAIAQFPTVNRCVDGQMHWCRVDYSDKTHFNQFEGGVSRILTNIWLNTICN